MRNSLDKETRELAQQVVLWARQLANVQQAPTHMHDTIDRFVLLLDLDRADVHRLRPFRVVQSTEEPTEHDR
jgi:hypothetical protein